MGVSYTAITLVGCKITLDMLQVTENHRVCTRDRRKPNSSGVYSQTDLTDCELESSGIEYINFKACPFCLGAIHKDIKQSVAVPEYEGEPISDGATIPTPDGFPYTINVLTDLYDKDESNPTVNWYVGVKLHEADGEYKTTAVSKDINIADIRNQLKSVLEPLGLWREHDFGIHTYMYVSY